MLLALSQLTLFTFQLSAHSHQGLSLPHTSLLAVFHSFKEAALSFFPRCYQVTPKAFISSYASLL